jgi:16S rRNA (cytosine967-C5)-methyltransferase
MVNYLYDSYCILNKVYADKTYLKQAIISTPIEEKNRSLTIKTCYGVLDKDIELSYYISALTKKTPKLAIRTILKIAMYNLKYLGKHDYAVTKNAVELVKKLGKGGTSGFVNAFLRKFVSSNLELPKDNFLALSVKYSYPEFLVKEIVKDYGLERAEKIFSSENKKTCITFYGIDGENYLTEKGINFEKTPYKDVFFAENFVRNDDYDKGVYTYQSIGSVAICDAVENGDNLLDCCSAPGGKSINLSRKFKQVVAMDIHPHRVELIEDYKRRMHVDNITTKIADSKEFIPEFESKFDAVLCDVPCSGSGVVNDHPDMKLNKDENSLRSLILEQKAILKTCSKYVKKGGYLYYSTCSILKRENIEVVNAFLKNNKDFVPCDITPLIPHVKCDDFVQFLPDVSFGLGFFVAKLKRI